MVKRPQAIPIESFVNSADYFNLDVPHQRDRNLDEGGHYGDNRSMRPDDRMRSGSGFGAHRAGGYGDRPGMNAGYEGRSYGRHGYGGYERGHGDSYGGYERGNSRGYGMGGDRYGERYGERPAPHFDAPARPSFSSSKPVKVTGLTDFKSILTNVTEEGASAAPQPTVSHNTDSTNEPPANYAQPQILPTQPHYGAPRSEFGNSYRSGGDDYRERGYGSRNAFSRRDRQGYDYEPRRERRSYGYDDFQNNSYERRSYNYEDRQYGGYDRSPSRGSGATRSSRGQNFAGLNDLVAWQDNATPVQEISKAVDVPQTPEKPVIEEREAPIVNKKITENIDSACQAELQTQKTEVEEPSEAVPEAINVPNEPEVTPEEDKATALANAKKALLLGNCLIGSDEEISFLKETFEVMYQNHKCGLDYCKEKLQDSALNKDMKLSSLPCSVAAACFIRECLKLYAQKPESTEYSEFVNDVWPKQIEPLTKIYGIQLNAIADYTDFDSDDFTFMKLQEFSRVAPECGLIRVSPEKKSTEVFYTALMQSEVFAEKDVRNWLERKDDFCTNRYKTISYILHLFVSESEEESDELSDESEDFS